MKKIILLADGTWNRPNQKDRSRVNPSNVVKFYRALSDTSLDKQPQLKKYIMGIGVKENIFKHYYSGITGMGIMQNIQKLYKFLVEHYEEGDELFLLGFSRGAYTIRSLSALIYKCGILTKDKINRISDVYNFYRNKKRTYEDLEDFRSKNCWNDKNNSVKFIGVWDTVGALGFPIRGLKWITEKRFGFHSERLMPNVENAFQALAIDEKRKNFEPSLWKTQSLKTGQRVEQVWFAGSHSNIGGGYDEAGLSDTTLQWMMDMAGLFNLSFDAKYIHDYVQEHYWGELRKSRRGVFWFIPEYHRKLLLEENLNESIHQSVIFRLGDETCEYEPVNVFNTFKDATFKTFN